MSPIPIEPARAFGPMRLVVCAFPSPEAARAAVEGALARRLAACASAIPVASRYRWRGRVEAADEQLVLFKTVPKRVGALFAFLKSTHPYDVPEIVEVDVPRVDPGYLAYLGEELDRSSHGPGRRRRSPPTRRGGRRDPGARRPPRTRGPPHRRSR